MIRNEEIRDAIRGKQGAYIRFLQVKSKEAWEESEALKRNFANHTRNLGTDLSRV